jgi:hypothetical protein
LGNIDPNDSTWKVKYNGTIHQWRLRRDAEYAKLRSWEWWMNAEICALYASINNFCRVHGVSQFGMHDAGLTQSALWVILGDVNAVSEKKRQMDKIRSVIRKASARRYKPLFDLATEAAAMRARRKENEMVLKIKPLHAILLSKFPSGDASSTPACVTTQMARKRKARSDEEDEADSTETGSIQQRSKRVRSKLWDFSSVCTMRSFVFGLVNDERSHSQRLSWLLLGYVYWWFVANMPTAPV